MRPFESLGLRSDGDRLLVLDQTQLPDREVWLDGGDPGAMVAHIQALRVRGAPLIGVAAAMSVGWFAEHGASERDVRDAALRLRAARPTAVNLMSAIDRMLRVVTPRFDVDVLVAEAAAIAAEDVALCEAMAAHGGRLLRDGDGVLTHCNTGGLATAGVGTALGVVRRAAEGGKRLHVFVDETRPLLQGARLTTWELEHYGIPYTLITDSMAPIVMRSGRVQRVLVGADRIARNGDVANKVGTYAVAVAARHHGIPFHPVAPWTTVDLGCANGGAIPIEERQPDEVRGVRGSFGAVRWSPGASPVYNPAFDVTPAELVTALVLDRGVLTSRELQAGGLERIQEPARTSASMPGHAGD
ncbi:MAG TPA: S-methyl-5-thioribose-1-phosphate isomerase [Streptosporangiaceae bacterium]|nr:S-methyl-5-thioribose-1-phosphate isomerase [Streptosporangiaceae bacterium]